MGGEKACMHYSYATLLVFKTAVYKKKKNTPNGKLKCDTILVPTV